MQTFMREENAERERERERDSSDRLAKKGREKSRMFHRVRKLPFFEEGSREGKANQIIMPLGREEDGHSLFVFLVPV